MILKSWFPAPISLLNPRPSTAQPPGPRCWVAHMGTQHLPNKPASPLGLLFREAPPTPSQGPCLGFHPLCPLCSQPVPGQVHSASWESLLSSLLPVPQSRPGANAPVPPQLPSRTEGPQFYSLQSLLHRKARAIFPNPQLTMTLPGLKPLPGSLVSSKTSPNSLKWPNIWPQLISHHSWPGTLYTPSTPIAFSLSSSSRSCLCHLRREGPRSA